MRVKVYRNLRAKCYSVQDASTNRVMQYAQYAYIANASFVVSEAGRQRVLVEKRKNVHSKVVGETTYAFNIDEVLAMDWVKVTYNPYKAGYFYSKDTGHEVTGALLVALTPTGVYAHGVTYGERFAA